MAKKQTVFEDVKVPNYEPCYLQPNQVFSKSIQVGDFYFERIADSFEHEKFRIEIGEVTEDLELAERELAILQERVKSLSVQKNGLASQVRVDENGDKYIIVNDSKKGIWVKNGAYVEMVTTDDSGVLSIVQRKDPQSFNVDLIAQAACDVEARGILESWGFELEINRNIQLEISEIAPENATSKAI